VSGPAEGKSARGRLLLWGCSYRAAPPVAAGRRTHGVGEAAADVSGPVEGARARGSSSSGGARKGAAPLRGAPPPGALLLWPPRTEERRVRRKSDGERKMGSRRGERKMGSFLQNGLRAGGRLIVKLPHLSP